MSNKNKQVIIAYFPGADKADDAADMIKNWDRANDDVKLGGVGILFWEDGKIKTRKVGGRAGKSGAKWGTALGAVAGILSGGATLIGGAVAGAVGGAVLGEFFHKSLGLSDEDKDRLGKQLQNGAAALVVMANADEAAATSAQLTSLGGTVESYTVPDETMDAVDSAEEVQPAADSDKEK